MDHSLAEARALACGGWRCSAAAHLYPGCVLEVLAEAVCILSLQLVVNFLQHQYSMRAGERHLFETKKQVTIQ